MSSAPESPPAPSRNEGIKAGSRYLRGTIRTGLADTSTGAVSEDDAQLLKFHGTYLQDDRDLRNERRRQKLEKAFIFMIRVRVPGGVCTPAQWLAMDRIAGTHANGTIKLTTRQAFQFHGVLKQNLRQTIKEINASLLDTLAACGDVNRNVMCSPDLDQAPVEEEVLRLTRALSAHLSPRTRAYHEIWLEDELVEGTPEDPEPVEPIYGLHYLPRKFKIVVAVPPRNDVDVFAHDLGFIAILQDGRVIGYNVTVGGGMGMSHGQSETFPRLADVLGFCTPDQAVAVAEKVVLVQRDFGDRSNRRHARLKYTIEDRGLDWFRNEVESRLGFALETPKPFQFTTTGDRYGWATSSDGLHRLTLFIQNGRVLDTPSVRLRTALREVAAVHGGEFRLTPNQNLIMARVSDGQRETLEGILRQHGVDPSNPQSGLRQHSLSCVALPTCGLALAESERHLPALLDQLEVVLEEAGLRHDAITIRNTGCPNGCARPYLGEIGLVGRAPGKYNLYLGAAFDGTRLNKLYKESVREEEIVGELAPIIHRYARERIEGERFGDFSIRAGYVRATPSGREFHQ